MVVASPPPDFVLSAFGDKLSILKEMASPWHHGRSYLCCADDKQFVLKKWTGSESLRQLTNESSYMEILDTTTFSAYAHMLKSRDGSRFVMEGSDRAWSAYEFIPGGFYDDTSQDGIHRISMLAADLHNCLSSLDQPKHSNLTANSEFLLNREILGHFGDAPRTVLERNILPELIKLENEKNNLSRSWIHGDLSYSNILLMGREPVLIDFEYCRFDYSALELAPFYAPVRDKNGRYVVLGWQGVATAAHLYAKFRKLDQVQFPMDRVPFFVMKFYIGALQDQIVLGSPYAPLIRDLISDMVSTLDSSKELFR